MSLHEILTWERGQSRMIAELSGYGRVLLVTDNGATWTGQRLGDWQAVALPEGERWTRHRASVASLATQFRLPLLWARRTVPPHPAGIPRHERAPSGPVSTRAAVAVETETVPLESPATRDIGAVKYVGFAVAAKRSRISLATLHAAVNAALLRARESWGGWRGVGLEIRFHDTGKALGLAFEPGTGAYTERRRISLNTRLLAQHDPNQIARVVLHELCHHYREERFPTTREVHDARFCAELSRADPVVAADPQECMRFGGEIDPTVVQERAAKKEQRLARAAWEPEAGWLNFYKLKGGQLRIAWTPVHAGTWAPVVFSLNDAATLDLLKRFAPADWARVAVRKSGKYLPHVLGATENLAAFAPALVAAYPKLMLQTHAYLTSLGITPTRAPR